MKMTTIMTVVAAMSSLSFAADATDLSMNATPAPDTTTVTAPTVTVGTPQPGTKDCGMLGWLNVDTITVDAANGDPVAQFTVAYLTDTGLADMPQDTDKANELYAAARPGLEKAAEAGNPHACRALAHMYEHGKGVEKDSAKAEHFKAMCAKCCKDKAAKDGKCCGKCAPKDKPADTPADKPADTPASSEM